MIGIKYCGGCNSHFDRMETVRQLTEAIDPVKLVPYRTGGDYEAVVIVCGCAAACTDIEERDGVIKIWVSRSGDLADAISTIKAIMEKA